jgi:hypothetical protein
LGLEVETAKREPERLIGKRNRIDPASLRVHDQLAALEVEVPPLGIGDASAQPVAKDEGRPDDVGGVRLRADDPLYDRGREMSVGTSRLLPLGALGRDGVSLRAALYGRHGRVLVK